MESYKGPDEYPIKEIPDTPMWSENFFLAGFNPQTGTSIFFSIGRWVCNPTLWRQLLMVSLPDGRIIYNRGFINGHQPSGPGGNLSSFEIVKPGKQVRLSFNGPVDKSNYEDLQTVGSRNGSVLPCKVDLLFDASAPMWNMSGDSVEASTIAGSLHTEQIGRINGSIEYAGEQYVFEDGYAIRDHSRGVRDIADYRHHSWLNGCFPDGRAFYAYTMSRHSGEQSGMSNAVVCQGENIYPASVRYMDVVTSSNDGWKTQKMILDSELGEMQVDIVKVLSSKPISLTYPFEVLPGLSPHINAAMEFDEAVQLSWNGQEGVGWSERGFASKPLG
jgi:hypothetical protein